MAVQYTVLTNNPLVSELIESETAHELVFIDSTVQSIISRCEELFLMGNYTLAADPLAGRRTRPFPCLTIILRKDAGQARAEDWNRITEYSALNSKRIAESSNCTERLKRDYQVLDWSFTRAALNL